MQDLETAIGNDHTVQRLRSGLAVHLNGVEV